MDKSIRRLADSRHGALPRPRPSIYGGQIGFIPTPSKAVKLAMEAHGFRFPEKAGNVEEIMCEVAFPFGWGFYVSSESENDFYGFIGDSNYYLRYAVNFHLKPDSSIASVRLISRPQQACDRIFLPKLGLFATPQVAGRHYIDALNEYVKCSEYHAQALLDAMHYQLVKMYDKLEELVPGHPEVPRLTQAATVKPRPLRAMSCGAVDSFTGAPAFELSLPDWTNEISFLLKYTYDQLPARSRDILSDRGATAPSVEPDRSPDTPPLRYMSLRRRTKEGVVQKKRDKHSPKTTAPLKKRG